MSIAALIVANVMGGRAGKRQSLMFGPRRRREHEWREYPDGSIKCRKCDMDSKVYTADLQLQIEECWE